MRPRRFKRSIPTTNTESAISNVNSIKIAKILSDNTDKALNCKQAAKRTTKHGDGCQEVQLNSQHVRPVRQRKFTKKLEESYISLPSSLSNNVTNMATQLPAKTRKRDPELMEKYDGLDEELLNSLKQAKNRQFMPRGEIFDMPQVKLEPLDDDLDDELSDQLKDETPLPKYVKVRRKRRTKLSSNHTSKSVFVTHNNPHRRLILCRSIFDNKKLRSSDNKFADRLPKPEMPKVVDNHIKVDQLRPVLGALVQGMEVNFQRDQFQTSFRTVQAAVVKHTPGLLPIFVDIMRDTQASMRRYGYFEQKKPVETGEDKLMKMLTGLKELRLKVAKKTVGIKEEPVTID